MINRQDERGEIALGCYAVDFAPAHPDGSMPTEAEWIRVGRMTLNDNLAVNIDRGTALELRDICNELMGRSDEEPTITYDFGLIGIPPLALDMFATADITGTGANTMIAIHSYRAELEYAVRFYAPGKIGSEIATYPNCTVSIDPATWTRETGYTSMIHITVLGVSMSDSIHGKELITYVNSQTGISGPVNTPNPVVIPQAGDTINVSFDKAVASLVASPAATWLTIAGSGTAWTVTASENTTGNDRVGTLVATGSDGTESTFTVTQLGATV